MPSLDATFTWALPVHAAHLTAHVQAYVNTLPAVNALRACNRFGKGPQCHISRLPVELVQDIAHYFVLAVRKKKLKKCYKLLRCYEDNCTTLNHCSRERMLEFDLDFGEDESFFCRAAYPDDNKLLALFDADDLHEDEGHYGNRTKWERRLETYLTKQRPLLQKHFGLDTWLSQVCIGSSQRSMTSVDTTAAYLTLPNRAERTKMWERDMSEDGYEDTKVGFGFAVAIDQHANPRDIQNFKRAMKILDLELFVHPSQRQVQERGLSLAGSTEMQHTLVVGNTAALFPRPLLLIRQHIPSEW